MTWKDLAEFSDICERNGLDIADLSRGLKEIERKVFNHLVGKLFMHLSHVATDVEPDDNNQSS
jgi:hypothetical protein